MKLNWEPAQPFTTAVHAAMREASTFMRDFWESYPRRRAVRSLHEQKAGKK